MTVTTIAPHVDRSDTNRIQVRQKRLERRLGPALRPCFTVEIEGPESSTQKRMHKNGTGAARSWAWEMYMMSDLRRDPSGILGADLAVVHPNPRRELPRGGIGPRVEHVLHLQHPSVFGINSVISSKNP